MKRRNLVATGVGLVLASGLSKTALAATGTIVVGGKNYTESLIMASMTGQLLHAHGYHITMRTGMGSTLLRQAMVHGEVDVYWEYTGTALIVYDKINKHLSAQETYDVVKAKDLKKGIVWLNPSGVNDTWGLAMNRAEAERLKITSISDLAKVINSGKKLTLATGSEFAYRSDGLKPMEREYGFSFAPDQLKLMAIGLTYQALHDHQVDLAMVYSTDGRIKAFDFVVLKDDKNFFPVYAMTPVIRQATLDANPDLATLLNALSAKLNDKVMSSLNAAVDVDKDPVQLVAHNFLESVKML